MADLLVPLATIATSTIIALIGAFITWRTLQQQRREWYDEADRREAETDKIKNEISESILRQMKTANESLQAQLDGALQEIETLRAKMAEREAYHERRYKELEDKYKSEIRQRDQKINSLLARVKELEKKNGTGPLKEP